MASTNKTSLGLNMWEASDKPVRQDFVNDNVIIDEKISELNSNLDKGIAKLNSDLTSGLAAKAATSHTHDERYYTETEINNMFSGYHKKISYGSRNDLNNESTIGTSATVMPYCEPNISFDGWLVANYHLTLRSTSTRANVYWMLDGAYIQGNEAWDGSINANYAFDKTFIVPVTSGQIIKLKMTDVNGVGIVSRGSNSSLNRFSFLYIPK